MKHNFLSDLCFQCMESIRRPDDAEQQQIQQEYEALEKKFVQTMGRKFVDRYQTACFRTVAWEDEAIFLPGLRFGVNFMLTVLPYSSNSTCAP